MKRGRPFGSQIRQNVVDILYFMKRGYGYDIFKVYKAVFPLVTNRVIYYHLARGKQLDIFKVDKVQIESGDYSWGNKAEKIYYALSSKAKPTMNPKVKEYFDKKKGKA